MTTRQNEVLPAGITKHKDKYRVTKTFLGKNYSFGTMARLYDAKCVNKNVDVIISFARENNSELINENIFLKGKITELEKKIELMEAWSVNANDKLEQEEKNSKLWMEAYLRDHKKAMEHLNQVEELKNRSLWQRILNV